MITEGLDGAVLPPFSPEEINGLNVYSDPPSIDRNYVDGSIVGTRVETSTLVATSAGAIEIPEISIPWWNINTNEPQSTVIPATTIEVATIAGVVPSEQAVVSTENIEELLAATPIVDQEMINAQEEAEFIEIDSSWLDSIIFIAFVIVILSIYRLVIYPNNKNISEYISNQRNAFQSRYSAENNERIAFRQLNAACNTRELRNIREALIRWCDHYVDSNSTLTMENILQHEEISILHPYVMQIQSSLFNEVAQLNAINQFAPQSFMKVVSKLRKGKLSKDKLHQHEQRFSLPPLYKTT
jgi:hypothetical protein